MSSDCGLTENQAPIWSPGTSSKPHLVETSAKQFGNQQRTMIQSYPATLLCGLCLTVYSVEKIRVPRLAQLVNDLCPSLNTFSEVLSSQIAFDVIISQVTTWQFATNHYTTRHHTKQHHQVFRIASPLHLRNPRPNWHMVETRVCWILFLLAMLRWSLKNAWIAFVQMRCFQQACPTQTQKRPFLQNQSVLCLTTSTCFQQHDVACCNVVLFARKHLLNILLSKNRGNWINTPTLLSTTLCLQWKVKVGTNCLAASSLLFSMDAEPLRAVVYTIKCTSGVFKMSNTLPCVGHLLWP